MPVAQVSLARLRRQRGTDPAGKVRRGQHDRGDARRGRRQAFGARDCRRRSTTSARRCRRPARSTRPPSASGCPSRGSATRCRSWPTSRCGRRSRRPSSSACAGAPDLDAPDARRPALDRFAVVPAPPLRRRRTATGARRSARRQPSAALHGRRPAAFYRVNYRPDNAALIVVGDIGADSVLPMLEAAFGSWKADGSAPAAAAAPALSAAQPAARQVFIVDKPGAPQSQIVIGGVGVARSTPDYFPIEVLNTHPRRVVHVAAEPEPAREARLHLRRRIVVLDAARAGPLRRVRRRADRGDGRGAEGVLRRTRTASASRSRPTSWRGRRTTWRSASPASSRRRRRSPAASRSLSPTSCPRTTSRRYVQNLQAVTAQQRPAGGAEVHPARSLRRRHRRRPEDDRGAGSRAEARACEGDDRGRGAGTEVAKRGQAFQA